MTSTDLAFSRLARWPLLAVLLAASIPVAAAVPVSAVSTSTGPRLHIKNPHYTSSPVICRREAPLGSYQLNRICKTMSAWRGRSGGTPEERQAKDTHNPATAVPLSFASQSLLEKALTQAAEKQASSKLAAAAKEADSAGAILEIEQHAAERSPIDRGLAEPWLALGDAQLAEGNFEAALSAYAESRQIIRLHHGLKSVEQIPSLQRSAKVEILLGRLVEANSLKEQIHDLVFRQYNKSDPRYVESTIELADWYLEHHHAGVARAMYSHLLVDYNPGNKVQDGDSVASIEGSQPQADWVLRSTLLRKFARTIRLQEYPMAGPAAFSPHPACCQLKRFALPGRPVSVGTRDKAVEDSLKMAIQLARKHTEEAAQSPEYISAALELGDWYFLIGEKEAAAKVYGVLASVESAATLLRKPAALHVPHPGNPKPLIAVRGRPHQGLVEVSAGISSDGRVVGGLEVIRSVPQTQDAIKYRQSARRGVYRPAFEDGEFKRKSGVVLVYDYVYLAP